MRNYLTKCSVVLLLTAAIVSCNKGGNEDSQSNGTGAYLRMKVDGVPWAATKKINNWGAQHIILGGKNDGDYPVLTANVPYNGAAGTFDITSETGSYLHFQNAEGKLYHITSNRGRGTITVTKRTEVNGQVMLTGTFEGTAVNIDQTDSVKITEGEFHDDKLD